MRLPYQPIEPDHETVALAEKILTVLVQSGLSYQQASSALETAQKLLDEMVCTPSSRQRNNLHFKRKISACIPHKADTDHYAADRLLWTSMGV